MDDTQYKLHCCLDHLVALTALLLDKGIITQEEMLDYREHADTTSEYEYTDDIMNDLFERFRSHKTI